jgi:serine/threonine-protein kinase
MGLAGWMLALGQLCTTCLLTYVLVLGYAGICLREARRLGGMEALRGAGVAAAATLIAFLLLLYPGLQTPQSVAHPGRALLERAGPLAGSTNEEMVEWLERLSPRIRQLLSDALASYNRSASLPQRAPRALIGPLEAPVRITEFSDILCGHCAALHETLEWLVEISPQGTLALEPRQFPLDGACNPRLEASAANSVRCIGARALICLEGRPGSFAFAGGLLANQQALTVDKIYEMAAPLLSREELEACITSAATQAKLEDDIAWALEHGIRGTPLVLVNGRQAPAFGPFLYAMVLARGDPGHRAFAELPPPASGIVR